MYCSSCGSQVSRADAACPKCGAAVTAIAVATPPPTAPAVLSAASFSWDAVARRLKEITLGEFEILVELGRGGMAAVFLAHEYSLSRKVALKVMSPAIMMGEGMVARFYAEAVTQASLTHPNIVPVHHVRPQEDVHFFVMGYVPGRSLQQVLKSEAAAKRKLSLPVIRSLLYQVGSALAYAHRKGVVHRDIKPANVLLGSEGDAVVTDFGIAKVMSAPSQTLTGSIVGTPPYMSPEQCHGMELTGASDQYSLGICAYELLTGSPPFSGNSFAVMQAHDRQQPPPILPQRPDCPEDLEAAVMRMLSKKAADRYPDILSALAALRAAPGADNVNDPVRRDLLRLADVGGVEAALGDVLRVPPSPPPRAKLTQEQRRTPKTPAMPMPAYKPEALEQQRRDPRLRIAMLRLSEAPPRVELGERIRMRAEASTDTGQFVPDAVLKWSSSNPSVLRVDSDTGDVEAIAVGSADIVVVCGDAAATARLSVQEPAAARIAAHVPQVLEVGDVTTLSAQVYDGRGRLLERPVKWSTSKAALAQLSDAGELAARAPGQVTITAVSGAARSEFPVTVQRPTVVSIEFPEAPNVLGVGETHRLVTIQRDKRGNVVKDRDLLWTTSSPSVAEVAVDGTVTARNDGEAIIETRCESAVASVALLVGLVPLTELRVQDVPASAKEGTSKRLKVTAIDSAGRVRRLKAEWSSSDVNVATVDASGVFTATRPGDATLRVRCGSIEKSFPITVTRAIPIGDRVQGVIPRFPPRTIIIAASIVGLGLVAAAYGPRAWQNWRSAASTVVSPDTARSTTVIPPPDTAPVVTSNTPDTTAVVPTVDEISIAPPPSRQLERGDVLILRAITRMSAPGTSLGPQWSSSDPAVLFVDAQSGRVEARAVGSATIEATIGTKRARLALAVVLPRVSALSIRGPSELKSGESSQLFADGVTSRGNALAPTAVTWTSSNPSVVSVTATGGVKAGVAGTAEVRASAQGLLAVRSIVVTGASGGEGVRVAPNDSGPGRRDEEKRDSVRRDPSPPPDDAAVSLRAAAVELAASCRSGYASLKTDQITALANGGSPVEQANQKTLLQTIKDYNEVRVTFDAPNPPVRSGATATVTIPGRVTWMSPFGRVAQSATISVVAALSRDGGGWRLASCRIQSWSK